LRLARQLLLDINKMGLPAGCEFLDAISPQYTADLVSWGAIGARTTESQVHRELTSALSMPTGFKNSTDGSVGIAVDACRAASAPHVFLSVGKEGLSSIVETDGNPDVHVILRGGSKGPNYAAEYVRDCGEKVTKAGLFPKVMVRSCINICFDLVDFNYGSNRLIAVTATALSNTAVRLMWPRTSSVVLIKHPLG
jgi:3-deoxy-7-phosphoheptulonate synthase